jgi:hypothetical protein
MSSMAKAKLAGYVPSGTCNAILKAAGIKK